MGIGRTVFLETILPNNYHQAYNSHGVQHARSISLLSAINMCRVAGLLVKALKRVGKPLQYRVHSPIGPRGSHLHDSFGGSCWKDHS